MGGGVAGLVVLVVLCGGVLGVEWWGFGWVGCWGCFWGCGCCVGFLWVGVGFVVGVGCFVCVSGAVIFV
ncbi:hypothetical protein RA268_28040 [Pseudomonas syringae pv. tagetis]